MNMQALPTPSDLLNVRFLNRDSAGMVSARLDDSSLASIVSWYHSPRGGGGGAELLRRRPVGDTLICANCWASDPDGTRDAALRQFLRGLAFGAACVDIVGDGVGAPNIDDVLKNDTAFDLLGQWHANAFLRDADADRAHAARLLALDRAADIIVLALFRLGTSTGKPSKLPAGLDHAARLVFLAGMAGAGVRFDLPAADLSGVPAIKTITPSN